MYRKFLCTERDEVRISPTLSSGKLDPDARGKGRKEILLGSACVFPAVATTRLLGLQCHHDEGTPFIVGFYNGRQE